MYPVSRRMSSVSTSATCLLPEARASDFKESVVVPGRHARITPVRSPRTTSVLKTWSRGMTELLGDLLGAELLFLELADRVGDTGSIQDLHGTRLHRQEG